MVHFKYLKTLSVAIQWEWSGLLVYLPNLPTAYAISSLEKFDKCNKEPIIWEYLCEKNSLFNFSFNLMDDLSSCEPNPHPTTSLLEE